MGSCAFFEFRFLFQQPSWFWGVGKGKQLSVDTSLHWERSLLPSGKYLLQSSFLCLLAVKPCSSINHLSRCLLLDSYCSSFSECNFSSLHGKQWFVVTKAETQPIFSRQKISEWKRTHFYKPEVSKLFTKIRFDEVA